MGITRPKYFAGQLLTADDLQSEQEYFLHKIRLHNRCLHGYGIACGLAISVRQGDRPQITVAVGVAVDAVGNMIEVDQPQRATLKAVDKQKVLYVVLTYRECPTDPLPVLPDPRQGGSEATQPARVRETFEISLQENRPPPAPKCEAGDNTCDNPPPLPIGRLRRVRNRWVLDRKFLPPRCK